MTPALALITGPAGHEVASVLRAACPPASPLEGQSCEPWWGEVREYLATPRRIALMHDDCRNVRKTEAAIRAEEGGEEWLCDRVLTDFAKANPYAKSLAANHGKTVWEWYCWHYKCRQTRYAIHAEDPPPLLVTRMQAWGGFTLECSIHPHYGFQRGTYEHQVAIRRGDQFVCVVGSNTWLEATQAALKLAGVQP